MKVKTHRGVVESQPNFSLRPEPIGIGRFSSGTMLAKMLCVFVLFLAVRNVHSVKLDNKIVSTGKSLDIGGNKLNRSIISAKQLYLTDLAKYTTVYYNPATGVNLKPEREDSSRDPLSTKIAYRGLPCQCENLQCSCCTGVNLTSINFNRRACTKFTYDPSALAINMALTMNEREIYTNTLSARNPPPLCAPVPYLPFVNFCIRFFDLHTEGRNLHACIDLETRIVGSPILTLHFNCVKVGVDGISWAQIGNITDASTLEMHTLVEEPEVYDEVEFEQQDLEAYVNYTSTLSPEEEAQIGQLKL